MHAASSCSLLRKLSANGRPLRPDGKQYLPRATMNDAIRIMQLAEVNRDV